MAQRTKAGPREGLCTSYLVTGSGDGGAELVAVRIGRAVVIAQRWDKLLGWLALELRAIPSDPLSLCPSILSSDVRVILKPGSPGGSRGGSPKGFCHLILGPRGRESVLSLSHSAKLRSSCLVGLARVM